MASIINAQTAVTADPGVISFDITDPGDIPANANTLSQNSIYKLKLGVLNGSQTNAIPDGSAYIRIGLGTKLIIDPAFNVATAPYNEYFTWSTQVNSGQVEIFGILHTALPADFIGELSFNVKANLTGPSSFSGNFLVSNNNPLYTLSDNNSGNNFTNLSYTVVVAAGPSVFFDSKTDVTCYGAANGSVTVHASGGTPPYQYSNDGGTSWLPAGGTNAAFTFTGLSAASYTIRARDNVLQTVVLSPPVQIIEPPAITISGSTTITRVVCVGSNTGAINMVAAGGSGLLEYSIDGGVNYSPSGIFTNLSSGNYTVRIKDAANCTKDTLVSLAPLVIHWIGVADNNWHNPLNWGNGKVPDAFTHVVIGAGTPFSCQIANADAFASSVRMKPSAQLQVINNRILFIQANCTVLPPE
jgi:SprB repeat